uniref:Uncharacterized protein n=1 Tax=Rhizophora mucronata TaxID=61149 RepID=A0A2P2MMS2_RHIMU
MGCLDEVKSASLFSLCNPLLASSLIHTDSNFCILAFRKSISSSRNLITWSLSLAFLQSSTAFFPKTLTAFSYFILAASLK